MLILNHCLFQIKVAFQRIQLGVTFEKESVELPLLTNNCIRMNVVVMAHTVFFLLTETLYLSVAPLCFSAILLIFYRFQIFVHDLLFSQSSCLFIQFIFIVCHCFSVNLWPLYSLPHTTMDLSSITTATTTPVDFFCLFCLFCLILFWHSILTLCTRTKDSEDDDDAHDEATGERERVKDGER